jgi:hypothetical protein
MITGVDVDDSLMDRDLANKADAQWIVNDSHDNILVTLGNRPSSWWEKNPRKQNPKTYF